MHCWIIPQLRRALLNHSTPWCMLGYVTPLHNPPPPPPPHTTMHCWSITLLHNALLKHHPTPQSIVKAPPNSTMHCWSITPLQNALATHHPTSQCIVEAPPHFTMHCWSTTPLHNALLKHHPTSQCRCGSHSPLQSTRLCWRPPHLCCTVRALPHSTERCSKQTLRHSTEYGLTPIHLPGILWLLIAISHPHPYPASAVLFLVLNELKVVSVCCLELFIC